MWNKFQKKYPVAYEIVQWGITALAMAGLVISAISLILQII